MVVEVKPQRPEEYSESDVKKLLNRYNHAKAIKDLWLPTFEECYEYAKRYSKSQFDKALIDMGVLSKDFKGSLINAG